MNIMIENTNEQKAAHAFSRQSLVFDEYNAGNTIIQYKRQRVRAYAGQYLFPESCILELNSGTGEDAIWFARQGHSVHATDIASGMMQVLRKKVNAAGLEDKITTELCSFSSLENLTRKGPYDLIFSNFAGMNCSGELNKVLNSFESLVKPGGIIVLVMLPSFCLWETLLVFKGKWKTAFRRFFSRQGVPARVEGNELTCWYYNPSVVVKTLKQSFDLLSIEGLCSLVPPSYLEGFAEDHPLLYDRLKRVENRLKDKWPWKFIGDYYIISMQRK